MQYPFIRWVYSKELQYAVSNEVCSPHTSCPVHVQSMSSPCPVHVQSMSSPCPVHVQFMSSSCPVHIQSMSSPCPVHVQFLWWTPKTVKEKACQERKDHLGGARSLVASLTWRYLVLYITPLPLSLMSNSSSSDHCLGQSLTPLECSHSKNTRVECWVLGKVPELPFSS